MNILYLTLYPIANFEEQHLVSDLVRYTVDQGHQVTVVTQHDAHTTKNQEYGCDIVRIGVKSTEKVSALQKVLRLYQLDRRTIKTLKNDFIKFDLVVPIVSHLAYAKTVKFLRKRDCAKVYMLLKDIFPYNALDLGILSKRGWKAILYHYFRNKEKKYYLYSDYIGCISPASVEFLLKENSYLTKEKVEENPNSIFPRNRTYRREELVAFFGQFKVPLDKKVFVYGGNLGKPQGVDFLIRCIQENQRKDIHFLIVGSGTEYSHLSKLIVDNVMQNVTLIPMQTQENFHKLLKISYAGLVFLNPKFTMPNYPSRTLAYMEESLPIIFSVDQSCDAGRIAEQNGYGINLISGNCSAFHKAIDRLADSPPLAKKMGELGRKYLEKNYHVSNSYQIIMKHFRGITNEHFYE